jgi:hypothetical protein
LKNLNNKLHLRPLLYKTEDFVIRKFQKFPSKSRRDSFPYLSSDTYYFISDYRIENREDISILGEIDNHSVIYIDGNKIPDLSPSLLSYLKNMNISFERLLIGDSDNPPESEVLLNLEPWFDEIFTVNLRSHVSEKVHLLPLGLESQRFRSAGQVRDFTKKPDFKADHREIDILVAWNDETWLSERVSARHILTASSLTLEIRKRMTARFIHHLMRKTKLVPCPRGNGVDTHRFWESLYLGALPVVLQKDVLLERSKWPHVAVKSWDEVRKWDKEKVSEIYNNKRFELEQFRNRAEAFLNDLNSNREKR